MRTKRTSKAGLGVGCHLQTTLRGQRAGGDHGGAVSAPLLQIHGGEGCSEREAPEQEAVIQSLRKRVCGTDHLITLAKRYTDIQELAPELLRLFIKRIVAHEKEIKWRKHAR